MRHLALCALAVLFLSVMALAEPVAGRIESVGLFKNGLAVVTRVIDVPGPGEYQLEDLPTPVHGTFFVQSESPVSASAAMREVMVEPKLNEPVDLQSELAGRQVTVHFREGSIPPVSGEVLDMDMPTGNSAWSRQYATPSYPNYGWQNPGMYAPQRFMTLQTAAGRSYVDSSMVAHVEVKGDQKVVRRRKPVLSLKVEGEGAQKITISYLTKGMAWAPSYQLDLRDATKLTLQQHAVLKNELADLKDVEIFLISGFPSVEMARVDSPLALQTSWAQFFSQLNSRDASPGGVASNMMQQAVYLNAASPDGSVDMSATPAGEGVDLHYQSIGRRTLGEGEALSLEVARADAEYSRIIEWVVPDTRNADGRYVQAQQDPERFQDTVWDALRFRNPLPFPMTTAPAAVFSGGRFNGQRTSYWVNTGEETTLRVTKALSIRTRSVEQEEPGERELVYIGGRQFRKVFAKGELSISNHRKDEVELHIRRELSGDLVEAQGDPTTSLREEGVFSINRRHELLWKVTLKPGEERKISYRYSVYVAH